MLGINKILALYVGPSGYAVIGQLQNAIQILTTLASGAINTGVIKYTAEYHDEQKKQNDLWKTAGTITIAGSIFTAVLISIFNKELAHYFLKDKELGRIFIYLSFSLTLFTLNTLILAILNGKKEIVSYVLANSAGSLLAMIFTGLMTQFMGLHGALVALASYQSVSLVATLWISIRLRWFKFSFLYGKFDREMAIKLGKYAVMAICSAVCVPLSQMIVRDHVGNALGWDYSGLCEAMWRLSAAYIMVVTSTLVVYYLPRLSEIKSVVELKEEILTGYKIILPMALVVGITMYLFRDRIIWLIFSEKFHEMRNLFGWQVMGDFLKIGSWTLACVMLSKAKARLFIVTEVLFNFSYVLLCWFFIYKIGFVGVAVAHAINYAAYWFIMWLFIWKKTIDEHVA